MKAPLKIWFDDKGDMFDAGGDWMINNTSCKSEPNSVFSDSLEFTEINSYYPRIWLKSTVSGRKYCMLLSDFEKVLKNKSFNDNIIKGDFTFTKKGQAQGVRLIIAKAP